jgi:hypothetical protein
MDREDRTRQENHLPRENADGENGMKNILLLASLSLSFTAQGSVVKVIGTNCGSKKVEVAGSGVIFTEKGQQYLVTSEHVAPVDSKLCYSGVSSSVETTRMTLINSDWEAGLALFKLESAKPNEQTTLDQFAAPKTGAGEVVHAIGFASSEYGQINDRARVTTTESDRTAFVTSGKNIEVAGVTSEPGLSGGAITDEGMKVILGILSHQKIKARPGLASGLVTLAQNSSQDPRILSAVAIPGDRVRQWADDAIHNNSRPNYSRDRNDGIRGMGLELKEKTTRPSEKMDLKNDEKSERRQEQMDSLKLGGDGVGIGGKLGRTPIVLQVSLLNLAELKAANQNLPEIRWLTQLASSLLNHPTVHVTGMVSFSSQGDIELQEIYSAADFLRKIRAGNAFPLLEEKLSAKINTEKNTGDIRSVLSLKIDSEDTRELFKKIEAIRALSQLYPQLRIPAEFLQKLAKHPGWAPLDEENFEAGVQARRYLLQLQ